MRKKTLKTAVIRPFVIVITLILLLFAFVWQWEYRWLSQNLGSKLVETTSVSIEQKLSAFVTEPFNANLVIASTVEEQSLYKKENLEAVENLYETVFKAIQVQFPQVSVLAYGDEDLRFIGIRANAVEGDFSLMLKDSRTQDLLNIYKTLSMDSEVLGSYKDYDPRPRPWYNSVVKTGGNAWSELYINVDERMDATISTSIPIRDANESLVAVVTMDVKLDGIHAFLKKEGSKGTGVMYVLDANDNIIAQSGDEAVIEILKEATPVGVLIAAQNTKIDLIRESYQSLTSGSHIVNNVKQFEMDGENYYAMVSELTSPRELGWKVAVVIPEQDIMGAVYNRQILTLFLITVVIFLGTITGAYFLSQVTKPINDSTDAALKISMGNWDTDLNLKKSSLIETDALITAIHNMTESLKTSFDEIRRQEGKYKMLVENVDDMIYSFKANGQLLSANAKFIASSRHSADKLFQMSLVDLFKDPAQRERITQQINVLVESKAKVNFVMELQLFDKSRSVYNVAWIPLLSSDGQIETILGTNTDITALVEAREALENMHRNERKQLEKMIDEKDERLSFILKELIEKEKLASLGSLVSGVAHEINTPLGVSISAASYMEDVNIKNQRLLETGEMTKSSLVEYMKKMDETAKILNTNLNRSVELVKSFKAIAVDQHIEEKTRFNISEYIATILLSLKHEYKTKGHRFEVDCNPEWVVKTYPGALSHIFTNLIINSIVHGFDERTGGLMKIDVLRDNGTLKIRYSDNGKGMSSETLAKIYDPFFTTNRGLGGSGLGLNVVYNIVTGQLNGKISCESAIGQGTVFNIEFDTSEV